MKIGFTGTRRGMTGPQAVELQRLMERIKENAPPHHYYRGCREVEGHHGDCIGADAQFHCECLNSLVGVVIHPPVDEEHRACCQGAVIMPPKSHFARNRDIVNETDMLIATPWQTERPAPKTGGGTWYTIEYAEKQGKPVTIIWPDGRVEASSQETVDFTDLGGEGGGNR